MPATVTKLDLLILCRAGRLPGPNSKRKAMKKIPSKLEVAPYALKMSEWVSGVEWTDTP